MQRPNFNFLSKKLPPKIFFRQESEQENRCGKYPGFPLKGIFIKSEVMDKTDTDLDTVLFKMFLFC